MSLPTKWGQLQLLAGLLVAHGDASSKIFNTESINYHMDRVMCDAYEGRDLSLYPSKGDPAWEAIPTVCNNCGAIALISGGYIVDSCADCKYQGAANRWKYQAELIEFKTQRKIHRRWAEMAIAQAIALRTLNNRSTRNVNSKTTGHH